jgi:type III secretion protein U
VSQELTGACALAGGLVALAFGGTGMAAALAAELRASLAGAVLSPERPAAALLGALAVLLRASLVPCAGALAGALVAGLLQSGFLLAPGALAPRLERIDPLRGLRRLFSAAQVVSVLLGLARAAALLAVAALWLRDAAPSLQGLARLAPASIWRVLPPLGGLAFRLALVLFAFGLLDLVRARRRHFQTLRLTKDEVRREHREDEGDPTLKNARLRAHRGLAEAGPLARATVVVVNPTHLAVALRHDRGGPGAPRVVAKGAGRAAARIRSEARRAGVPVVHDVPLARALHRLVEVGDELPEELYEAAAVVLAHLYRREDV